jgi:hypothetical protein
MKKIDLRKKYEKLYKLRRGTMAIVRVPELLYLMIDGRGHPNTSTDFQDAMQLLFSLSYTMKFMMKLGKKAIDYAVMPPEALWWAEGRADFMNLKKDEWQWTLMILQPDVITEKVVQEAIAELKRKKKDLPALGKQQLVCFEEGECAQTLHIGPYDKEGPTIARLLEFIKAEGRTPRGKHHEIYFGDPRRANPETLKTIVRQPIS